MAARAQRKPTFLWQGVLILLPVAALSVVSLISLSHDERTAEQDARNRGAEDAQSLARAMRVSVDEEVQRYLTLQNEWAGRTFNFAAARSAGVSFLYPQFRANIEKWEDDYPGLKLAELATPRAEILTDGRQIEPPYIPAVPVPPKWFCELTPKQRSLWEALRAAGTEKEIKARFNEFVDSDPSPDARAAAMEMHYSAVELLRHAGNVPSETGVSFEDINCYRLLTAPHARLNDSLLEAVWWHVLINPSFMSPKLLALAVGLTNRTYPDLEQRLFWMQRSWKGQSQARRWLGPLRRLPGLTNWNMQKHWAHWTSVSGSDALAFFEPCTFKNMGNDANNVPISGPGYHVWFVPRPVIEAIFAKAMAENKFLIPRYVQPVVTLDGVQLSESNHAIPNQTHSLLGTAKQEIGARMMSDAATFRVNFYLTSREQMLSAERRRTRLFAALILGAAFAALVGLAAAWRAFRRQQQLNELKSNFVSSVSHELRAPIASVRLMAENLESGKIREPQKQSEYFGFIVQECRRLSSLIQNVLDFSRIEQGRKQYEFEPTDLVALAQSTVKLMEPYAAEKGVNLTFETSNIQHSTFNIELQIDGRAIQQALVNLIDNAIKHSPKGETVTVKIFVGGAGVSPAVSSLQPETSNNVGASQIEILPEVSTSRDAIRRDAEPDRPEARATHGVLISVTDHGPGIPRREHEKIFERFYRRGSELRRETQGVGIGLSLVKHIVEAHGGCVTVQSEPGQGSRFTIELPIGK